MLTCVDGIFLLQFGLSNELIAPKDNKGESICDIEILALLAFFKPYISVQESYRYINMWSRYGLKCPKMVPKCLSALISAYEPRLQMFVFFFICTQEIKLNETILPHTKPMEVNTALPLYCQTLEIKIN